VLLILSIIAAYAAEGSITDLFVCVGVGFLGYILRRNGFPLVNLVMGLVLGKLMETSFAQSLMITGGTLQQFYTRPVTLTILVAGLAVLAWGMYGTVRRSGAAAAHPV
jgi:putative tricarboxylic transport membrane protein